MGRIAEAAGVPLATAFVHFPTKQAFALAMYHGLVADLQAQLADLPDGAVAERFAALMTLKLDLLDAHRDEMCALLAAAVDPKGPLGVLSESTAAIRARMAGTVHAVVAGATDAPPEPARLAGLLYGLHLAIVLLWTQDDGRMARGTIGLCRELLALAGPLLPLPEVAAGLGRLDAVFGDRLAPVVGADVERGARWLLARLMRHRRLLPGVAQGPATEDQLALHLPAIRAAIQGGRPLELVLPAFPAKSPNAGKVLGKLPDMAEQVALRSLQTLCEELAEAHPPGVRMLVCSDGLVFADLVAVADEDVAAYGAEIDRLLQDMPLLRRFDLAHAFGAVTPAEARRRLLAGWGETEAELDGQLRSAPALGTQLDGLHRFMFEDGLALHPGHSRSQVRKWARMQAVQVLLRSRAWGRMLTASFPEAIRLSIHPQPALSDKLGIHLLPTQDVWLTPWHGVALLERDRFRLVKRSEAEAMGAIPEAVDGRPSHYRVSL